MPAISPAINIGIGGYGAICMEDLANNFGLRESQYTDYVSFHQLNLVDGMLTMHNYDFRTQNFHEYKLSSQNNGEEDSGHSRELHNFISQTYNHLITLTRGLKLNVNFNSIHINLIFAAYEDEHLELLKETILLIDRLKRQGDFGEVRIKCFSILSDGEEVSTPSQEEIIVKTLDSLVEIRKNQNVLSHNFILDDKNTQAVSLKVKNNYISFAISEIIVALIRNEYSMLGALQNPIGVASIGMGMVYFDIHFFNAFIKNRILGSKIEIEKIHGKKTEISTSEYKNAVETWLIPYVEGAAEIDSMIENIRATVAPDQFENTLRCYQFLLANLLGHHDRITLVEPIEADELYSIKDMIYWNLQQYVLTDDDKKDKGLLELKNYKRKLTEYNTKIHEGNDPSDTVLTKEKRILERHENAVAAKIQHYANKTRRKNIGLNHGSQDLKRQLAQAKRSQKDLEENFTAKNWLFKLFGRKEFEKQKENSELQINSLEADLSDRASTEKKLKIDLEKLYEFKSELEKIYQTLNSGIEQIFLLKKEYQSQIDGLPYLDYEFLHNIISPDQLEAYEFAHKEFLQVNIKEVLNILFIETVKKDKSFTYLLDKKITSQTDAIIDFNMTHHLLNEYDAMDLLKPIDFDNDLQRLKQRAYPFFNTIPTYTHKSHYLKYFDNADSQRTIEIQKLLNENYAGTIPSYINSESPNKFALLTIEVIEELRSIVKYNNHFLRNNP